MRQGVEITEEDNETISHYKSVSTNVLRCVIFMSLCTLANRKLPARFNFEQEFQRQDD